MRSLIDGFMADFETTTREDDCRVWAWSACPLKDITKMTYGKNISEFMKYCKKTCDVVFFHNLAFDGKFIIDWLFRNGYSWVDDPKKPQQFGTLISDLGKFYSITVKWDWKNTTEFLDSYKKLPISVAEIARSFELPESKGDIDYRLERPKGWEMTDEERDYIRRDVEIVARALDKSISEGMEKMTVASDSMTEYKRVIGSPSFKSWFPEIAVECDDVIRRSYRGGFTYRDPRRKGIVGEGIVLDVNSLYPSVMYNELLPYSFPEYFSGIPQPTDDYPLYVANVTFTCRLKKNHIPCLQIRNSPFYSPTKYVRRVDEPISLTMTSVDIELLKQQYHVNFLSFDGGFRFRAQHGMFTDYIDKWSNIKANSTGGMRYIAKLHLNSLYGKFATNPVVTSKRPVFENNMVKYRLLPDESRKPVYTAAASFITAYARTKTITAAQKHYDRFCYADTDSLHLLGTELPDDLDIHPSRLGAWKHESTFTRAVFIRAKAYAEEIEWQPVVHVAGMPLNMSHALTIEDVLAGGEFSGKLVPKTVPGGVVLTDTTFTLE